VAIGKVVDNQSNFHANPIYWEKFRERVFSLLKMGYDRLSVKAHKDSEETEITGELVKVLRDITEEPSSSKWTWHFSIHDDLPVNVPDRRGKRRPRLDIQFERTGRGPHPHYAFEAKRLAAGHNGVSDYLGKEGLGRFLRGLYAQEDSEAGMLGYVQSDSEEYWLSQIRQRLINNVNEMHVCTGGELVNAPIIPALIHCYRSKHTRISSAEPIIIYHLLLLFC
jgi:hypothetical protein